MKRNRRYRATLLAILGLLLPGILPAGEPPSQPILRFETAGMHGARINRVSADAEGRFLLTCSYDKTARLWDREGRQLAVYRVPVGRGNEGMLYACALSPDASLAAVGGWTGIEWDGKNSIYIFDRRSGAIVRRISGLSGGVNDLCFSADGRYLASGQGAKNGIRVFETSGWTELGRDADFNGDCYGVSFGRLAGTLLLAAVDYSGSIGLYEVGSGLRLLAKVEPKGGQRPFGLAFSPDGGLLACGFSDTTKVEVYAVTRQGLSFSHAPDTSGIKNGNVSKVAFSSDGRYLIAGGRWALNNLSPLRRWSDAGRGGSIDIMTRSEGTIMDIQELPGGAFLFGAADPSWGLITPEGKLEVVKMGELADLRGNRSGFRVSADGQKISFSFVHGGKASAVFDLANANLSLKGGLDGLTAPETKGLAVTDWENKYEPKLDGKPLALGNLETSRSLAMLSGRQGFLIGSEWNIRRFDAGGAMVWRSSTPGVAWAVNVSGDGRLALAALSDGTIRWYRTSDGKELAAFYPHGDKKRWVLATASGYYDCSPGGEELLGWLINQGKSSAAEFYSASRFRSSFYRPDVVKLALSLVDEPAALARANAGETRAQPAAVAALLPPTVKIISPESGSRVSTAVVKIDYRVQLPAGESLKSVRALVDGRPAESKRGLAVLAAGDAQSLEMVVPSRDCEVSLIAETARGATSEAAVLRIIWAGGKLDEFVIKPKLYVLAVGVSAYRRNDLRLQYAAKDAKDFAAAFSTQKGRLYRDVSVKLLTDAQADKNGILDGLDWIQKETTAKDVAAVFLAGHGVNDPYGVYYFLPSDADPERLKRSGLPFTDIKLTVQAIAGKALFFVDSCHAGNVMGSRRGGGTDMTALVNELSSAENGAVVFSASTGSQYSLEDKSWGNGAFTKAVVEGLAGKADYGGQGRITVNMLDLYISERVKELTKGRQTPTTLKPPSVPDFPVAAKR